MARAALLLASVSLLAACEVPREPLSLVDHEIWEEVSEAEDPFDDRPVVVTCSVLAWGLEDIGEPSLEVETEACNYLTVVQPSQAEVLAGDELHIRLWHNQLTGPVGTMHAAILLDGEVVFEVEHDIPSSSVLESPTWTADVDVPVGVPLHFHLHNHGANSYNFIEFSDTPP